LQAFRLQIFEKSQEAPDPSMDMANSSVGQGEIHLTIETNTNNQSNTEENSMEMVFS
jgi:hypothetical protein